MRRPHDRRARDDGQDPGRRACLADAALPGGLRRLGFDPYYVEAHARTPSMLMRGPTTTARRAPRRSSTGCCGRSASATAGRSTPCTTTAASTACQSTRLRRLYRDAELDHQPARRHGPAPELADGGRLVYLETDPVELADRAARRTARGARVPRAARRLLHLRREPRRRRLPLPSAERLRLPADPPAGRARLLADIAGPPPGRLHDDRQLAPALARGRARRRDLPLEQGLRVEKFLDLPRAHRRRSSSRSRLRRRRPRAARAATAGACAGASSFSADLDAYRDLHPLSRGEFTVAKDQNVRLRTGWFSDRSATYLAAGRPVVTQDTGFGAVLPTGEGLFAVHRPRRGRRRARGGRVRLRASRPRGGGNRPRVPRRRTGARSDARLARRERHAGAG